MEKRTVRGNSFLSPKDIEADYEEDMDDEEERDETSDIISWIDFINSFYAKSIFGNLFLKGLFRNIF